MPSDSPTPSNGFPHPIAVALGIAFGGIPFHWPPRHYNLPRDRIRHCAHGQDDQNADCHIVENCHAAPDVSHVVSCIDKSHCSVTAVTSINFRFWQDLDEGCFTRPSVPKSLAPPLLLAGLFWRQTRIIVEWPRWGSVKGETPWSASFSDSSLLPLPRLLLLQPLRNQQNAWHFVLKRVLGKEITAKYTGSKSPRHVINKKRGAPDRGEYRQAAGAIAQVLVKGRGCAAL
jgi:hypothetical protein